MWNKFKKDITGSDFNNFDSTLYVTEKIELLVDKPASTIAGLLLEQTESTLMTREVVHSSFSYVYDFMIRTSSPGPPLARIISWKSS